MTLSEGLTHWAAEEDLKAEVRRLSRALSRERDSKVSLEEAVMVAARACFKALEPATVLKPGRDRRKGGETAVVCCSDWHVGSLTPNYSVEVAEERVRAYAAKVLELTAIQRADHPVRDARVYLLGDLVHGENVYPGAVHEQDASLIQQVVGDGLRILRDFLLTMAGTFDTVTVVAVPGNHGRMAPRSSPFHPDTNADRLLYLTCEQATRHPRIGWRVARGGKGESGRILVDRVGNWGALVTHGDLFRGGSSFLGLPFYRWGDKALKWRVAALAGQMEPFDDVICGHVHRRTVVEVGPLTIRSSGSLLTMDPYSREEIATVTRPTQLLLFVHPDHGVTAEYRVNLP